MEMVGERVSGEGMGGEILARDGTPRGREMGDVLRFSHGGACLFWSIKAHEDSVELNEKRVLPTNSVAN